MSFEDFIHNYEYLRTLGTGSLFPEQEIEYITIPFGKYMVKVRVNGKNEFLGIEEISVDKEYLSFDQRVKSTGHFDVEKYYVVDDK